MVRKCGGTTAEVELMDAAAAGVRTRSRAAATASSAGGAAATADLAKRRRTEATGDEESPLKLSSNNSTCPQLRNSSGGRNLASRPPVAVAVTENLRCPSTSSEDQASVSCCSSYGSSEVEKGKLIGFTDLEEECEADSSTSRFSRERREKTPSSEMGRGGGGEDDSMDSSVGTAAVANLPQRSEEEFQSSVDAELGGLFVKIGKPEIKRPSDFEIEEFFAAAEAENLLELKHFKNKYNFDFVKEEPLKGRFEWHQVPPAEGKVSSK